MASPKVLKLPTAKPRPAHAPKREGELPLLPIVQPTLPPMDAMQPYLDRMWRTGIVTTGPITREFEDAVAAKVGVKRAVMVNHGTTALMLAARAMGLTGEVIIPAFTWTATAGALAWDGLEPVFADITPGRLTLDPEAAERAITRRTSAIMPVNAFGVPAEMEAFEDLARRKGLRLLSDSAQGLGALYRGRYQGGFGDAECFSMSPTKVVTAIEGGLVTTNDDQLASVIVSMRDSGKNIDGSDIVRLGLSGRPSEFHAAVALLGWRNVEALMAARMERMGWYRARLADLPGISFQQVPRNVSSTGNYFVIFVDAAEAGITRDELYAALKAAGIQGKKYFYPALHLQEAYASYRSRYEGKLPVTEQASLQGLALPLYSHMTRADVERVCAAIVEAPAAV